MRFPHAPPAACFLGVMSAVLSGAIGAAPSSADAPASVTDTASSVADAAPAPLGLGDCLLPHPLRLASVPARCGRLRVPEDPANPHGPAIDLAVAVIPALDRRSHQAPLFVLAGGPGQSASDLYVSHANAFAPANRDHDIVLLDQRGTGGSHPLRCRFPEDWQESGEILPQLRAATLACLREQGERVRFYTSSVAVTDLERARLALGYRTIDLYGASYGTRMAELYMRRHPASTHAVVLDGVTDPERAIGPDTPADGERALELILARCAAAPDCVAAFPDLGAELVGLRRRFGAEKAPLALADPTSGSPMDIEFSRSTLSAALRLLSYSSSQAALLPVLVHQAAQGRLAPLAAQPIMMAREIGDQLAIGMQLSVVCSEDEPFFPQPLDRERLARTYQGTEQLDAFEAICPLWPRGPVDEDLHRALRSDVPTLLLSGEADPVTPPAEAERVAGGLTRHRHLIVKGEGHGQLTVGCMPRIIAEFLDRPDPAALDAACLARHRPAPFFVALTGPAP